MAAAPETAAPPRQAADPDDAGQPDDGAPSGSGAPEPESEPEPGRIRRTWRGFVGWCGGSHPVARTGGALVAAAIPVVSTLLALGVVRPFAADAPPPLVASQAKTLDAGTARMRIDVRTPGANPLRYVATGRFDFREERGTFSYNLTQLRGSRLDAAAAVEARFFQHVAYLRFPDPRDPRRPWLLIDLESDPGLLAQTQGDAAGTVPVEAVAAVRFDDPTAVLAAMDRSGDVEALGAVREYGLDVRKFRGRLPSASGRGEMVATAWIGDDDLVRRLELSDPGAGSVTTMGFYDFGIEVATAPPPGDEVDVLATRLKDALGR